MEKLKYPIEEKSCESKTRIGVFIWMTLSVRVPIIGMSRDGTQSLLGNGKVQHEQSKDNGVEATLIATITRMVSIQTQARQGFNLLFVVTNIFPYTSRLGAWSLTKWSKQMDIVLKSKP
ncbi:unnamed protein product [Citrullus colocynthis]|uniref:Uncharacterized protein n=1 Tax=Citrullus colocynthis TaxID=252529 RepID=A0ABP0Z9F8_9ROSI